MAFGKLFDAVATDVEYCIKIALGCGSLVLFAMVVSCASVLVFVRLLSPETALGRVLLVAPIALCMFATLLALRAAWLLFQEIKEEWGRARQVAWN